MDDMLVMLFGGFVVTIFWIFRLLSIWIFIDSKKYKYSYGIIWAIANLLVPGFVLAIYFIRFKIKKLNNRIDKKDV